VEVVLVKKRLANGHWCARCGHVHSRLEQDGLSGLIDRVVVAEERDPDGEGMRLAWQYGVRRAPFFIVRYGSGESEAFDAYMDFRQCFAALQSVRDARHEELVTAYPEVALL
jgi:hypothetical protein